MALSTRTTASQPTSSVSDQPNEQSGLGKPRKSSGTTSGSTEPIEDIVEYSTPTKPRLIVSIEGEEKTGKDHFAFTAPGPVYLQTCDPEGTDGVRQKFPGKIFGPTMPYQLKCNPNDVSAQEMKRIAEPILNRWVANYRAALPKVRTIVWDTADELWELTRLAKFGELTPKMGVGDRNNQYGELNNFYESLIKESFAYPVNFVLIHRLKDQYTNNARTGARIRAGYKDVYYLTQVNLRSFKTVKEGGVGVDFGVKILDCRRNPDIEGGTMPNNFQQLAMEVLPDVDPDNWL